MGEINYQLIYQNSYPNSNYGLYAIDLNTGQLTQILDFSINEPVIETSQLTITHPTDGSGLSIQEGETISIEWTDEIFEHPFYTSDGGALRDYHYKIYYRQNNGEWMFLDETIGVAPLNSTVSLFKNVSIPITGDNFEIKVEDALFSSFGNKSMNNDISRFDISEFFSILLLSSSVNISFEWDYSYPKIYDGISEITPLKIKGVAADGVSRFLVKIESNLEIDNINVSLSSDVYPSSSPAFLGKLKSIGSITELSSYIENNYHTSTNIEITLNPNDYFNDEGYYFWYISPEDFCQTNFQGHPITNNLYTEKSKRSVDLDFEISLEDGSIVNKSKSIEIVRPPLVLAHGLAGYPSGWDNFKLTNGSALIKDNRYKIKKAITLNPSSSFDDNTDLLLKVMKQNKIQDGVISGQKSEKASLFALIFNLRNKGYACNQVHYVGHSMGGSVIRNSMDYQNQVGQYTGPFWKGVSDGEFEYRSYGEGLVDKFITLNTPHNGSPLANFLFDLSPYLINVREHSSNLLSLALSKPNIFSYVPQSRMLFHIIEYNPINDSFGVSPAVENLKKSNGVIFNGHSKNKIPSHFFVGDMNINNENEVFTSPLNSSPYYYINFPSEGNQYDNVGGMMLLLNGIWDGYKSQLNGNSDELNELNLKVVMDNLEIQFIQSPHFETRNLHWLNFMLANYYGKNGQYENYLDNSDLIVDIESQSGGYDLLDPNITLIDGNVLHCCVDTEALPNTSVVTTNSEVADDVFHILNSSVSSNLFAGVLPNTETFDYSPPPLPEVNPDLAALNKGVSNNSDRIVVSQKNTGEFTYLKNTSSFENGGELNFTIHIDDTINYDYLRVYFQQGSFLFDEGLDSINIQLQIDNNYIGEEYIDIFAVYRYPDTTKFIYLIDTLQINPSSIANNFSIQPSEIILEVEEEFSPTYFGTFNNSIAQINSTHSFLNTSIMDESIIEIDSLGRIKAKNEGGTKVIAEFQGLYDTLLVTVEPISEYNLTIPLTIGWNLISTNIIPSDLSIDSVFQTISPYIEKIKNIDENFDPTIPPFLNTLSEVNISSGYWVKVSQDCTLSLWGIPVNRFQEEIQLEQGWNLVSFYGRSNTDIDNAIYSINPYVEKVKNISKNFDPNIPSFLNTLGELIPGEGYWIKVSEDCVLKYDY